MLRDKKFIIAITVAVLLIILIGVFRPREIDWTPTFSSEDKIPYGTYVLYNSLGDIFEKQDISVNTSSVYSLLHKKNFENTSLLFFESNFTTTVKERKELLGFAAKGNNVFISAGHIPRTLANILKISENRRLYPQMRANATEADTASYAQANFTNPELRSDSGYLFKKDFYSAFYTVSNSLVHDTARSVTDTAGLITVLGVDAENRPTFICINYGKGHIFVHNNPYAFTNYYILKPRGGEYVAKCLSYLPQGRIILDASNQKDEIAEKAPLNFILGRESLRWAYYTTIAFLLLYVLFNVKRRQRIIPIIEPYKNTSLEFTQTIGSLYFNQSNHKNIAKKKITYFLEFIRNRYNIDTTLPDEELIHKLALKSGISPGAVEHLLTLFSGIAKKNYTTSTELIDLNHAIEYFKHNCQ